MTARKARVYRLEPAGFLDRADGRLIQHAGKDVHIVQPHGTPRNGTMGMVYIQVAETGEFIGLASKRSLQSTGRSAPVRDRAAEAREQRSVALRRHL